MSETKKVAPRGPDSGQKHATKEETEQGYRTGSFTMPALVHPDTGEILRASKEVPNYIALDREGRDLGHASLDLDHCLKLRRATLKIRAAQARNR